MAWKRGPGGEDDTHYGFRPTGPIVSYRSTIGQPGWVVAKPTRRPHTPTMRCRESTVRHSPARESPRPPTLDPVLRPYDLPRAAVPGFAPVFGRMDLFQAIELAN